MPTATVNWGSWKIYAGENLVAPSKTVTNRACILLNPNGVSPCIDPSRVCKSRTGELLR
jgi:hypothetical protein